MIRGGIAALAIILAACSSSTSEVDKRIDQHPKPMQDFLTVAQDHDVLTTPEDVDKVATFFSTACTAQTMGVMQQPQSTVDQLHDDWGMNITLEQAQALHQAHPELCNQQQ